jgi:hypothetical protein
VAEDRFPAARATLALVEVAAHSPRLEDTPALKTALKTALDDQMDSPRATQVLHWDQWSWFLPLRIGKRREPTPMRADHPRASGRTVSISQREGVHSSSKSGSNGSLGKRCSKCGMLAHDRLWGARQRMRREARVCVCGERELRDVGPARIGAIKCWAIDCWTAGVLCDFKDHPGGKLTGSDSTSRSRDHLRATRFRAPPSSANGCGHTRADGGDRVRRRRRLSLVAPRLTFMMFVI